MISSQPPVEFHWLRVGCGEQLEALACRGGKFSSIDFPSYVGLIRDPAHPERGWTLFDTGYASHFFTATATYPLKAYRQVAPVELPESEHLTLQLAGLGIDPGDVRRVVVSHFHVDHVSGLADFPNARVIAGKSGLLKAHSVSGLNAARQGMLPSILPSDVNDRFDAVADFPAVSIDGPVPLQGWDLFGDQSLIAVDLPGHFPGHLGLLLTTVDHRQVLLVGDAAWQSRSFADLTPPARMARIFFDDWATAMGTLGHLHALHRADTGLAILPAHCATGAATWLAGGGGLSH